MSLEGILLMLSAYFAVAGIILITVGAIVGARNELRAQRLRQHVVDHSAEEQQHEPVAAGRHPRAPVWEEIFSPQELENLRRVRHKVQRGRR